MMGPKCPLRGLPPGPLQSKVVSVAGALPLTAPPQLRQLSLAAPTIPTNFRVGFQLWLDFSV